MTTRPTSFRFAALLLLFQLGPCDLEEPRTLKECLFAYEKLVTAAEMGSSGFSDEDWKFINRREFYLRDQLFKRFSAEISKEERLFTGRLRIRLHNERVKWAHAREEERPANELLGK